MRCYASFVDVDSLRTVSYRGLDWTSWWETARIRSRGRVDAVSRAPAYVILPNSTGACVIILHTLYLEHLGITITLIIARCQEITSRLKMDHLDITSIVSLVGSTRPQIYSTCYSNMRDAMTLT